MTNQFLGKINVRLLLKCLFSVGIACALVSCNKDLSYAYLVEHPKELRKEVTRCQKLQNQTPAETKQCETVMFAATNFISTLEEQQQDPEKFGQRVLDLQAAYVTAKVNYQTAVNELDQLKQQTPTSPQLASATAKVAETQKIYNDKKAEVKFLLAVIGVNSPE